MEKATLFADVIVPLAVPNRYTYRIPEKLNAIVSQGKRVLVQFGKSKIYTGIVYSVHNRAPAAYTAKYIDDVLDDVPIVNETQLRFWDWIAFYYCANPGDVMNAALPSGLKLNSTAVVMLRSDFALDESDSGDFSAREHELLDILVASGSQSFDKLSQMLGVKSVSAIVGKLQKKGAVEVFESVNEKYKPKLESFVRLAAQFEREDALAALLPQLEKKAFRQAEAVLSYVSRTKTSKTINGWIPKKELAGASDTAAVSALVKKGIFEENKFETGRLIFESGATKSIRLSGPQEEAVSAIHGHFSEGKPVLLQGVTGSGKTEVYIQLIRETLGNNREALLLVPEIALTTQLITRLRSVFGDDVGVYHSRFSENERVEIWQHIQSGSSNGNDCTGRYRVIVGPRSALFLPFSNLGLIVVDEEHESSYKQHDPAPRYHARDAAIYLAGLHKANILLGTATPSVETCYNCLQGKYARVKLPVQYVAGGGTDVEVCDLLYFQNSQQMRGSITPPLFDAMKDALAKKRQVILFQNRRGFAPYTECIDCAHVPHCVQCDVSLIYHKAVNKLVCHYCGFSTSPPQVCAACGSNRLRYRGMGTEKVEEDIELLFPDTAIARMDLDATRSRHSYSNIIDDFAAGNTRILIGTQMVTKGLDFANVSVVGILNADALFNFPDFRSFERAFQLITQVRGRAGRSGEKGKVFVQTTQTSHPVIQFVRENNVEGFIESILEERRQFDYPPFVRLIAINVISGNKDEAQHLAHELSKMLLPLFPGKVLGPDAPLVGKIRNKYYRRLLVKASRDQSPSLVRDQLASTLNDLKEKFRRWDYRVVIDVDPV